MYKLFKENYTGYEAIIRTSDNAYIPINPDNSDYQQYLKWVSEGGVPLPAENT